MITTAIGKPTPNALSVARANSESRFAWGRTSGNDMALLLGAPASPRMNDEYPPSGQALFRPSLGDSLYSGMLSGYG